MNWRRVEQMKSAVVTWASLKGGAGKTTGGLNLAVAAEGQGIPTAVIDLDPQQAAAKWGDARQTGNRPPCFQPCPPGCRLQ